MTGYHPHGSAARYDHGSGDEPPCRQDCCRRAKNIAVNRRLLYPTMTPAGPVVAHIQSLRAAGMSYRQIAECAGVTHVTISRAHVRTRMTAHTARKVLAVRPGDQRYGSNNTGSYIPALGTQRRIHGCVAVGWTVVQIAAEAGVDRWAVQCISSGQPTVRGSMAKRIQMATWRLIDQRPPQRTWTERRAVANALALAARRGWVPLACWDDLDDPHEIPKGIPKARDTA